MLPSRDVSRLIEIMAALRSPGTGCAWDLEQTFETIVPYTIEESYEIADAVARGDMGDLKEELGIFSFRLFFSPASPTSRACSISAQSSRRLPKR